MWRQQRCYTGTATCPPLMPSTTTVRLLWGVSMQHLRSSLPLKRWAVVSGKHVKTWCCLLCCWCNLSNAYDVCRRDVVGNCGLRIVCGNWLHKGAMVWWIEYCNQFCQESGAGGKIQRVNYLSNSEWAFLTFQIQWMLKDDGGKIFEDAEKSMVRWICSYVGRGGPVVVELRCDWVHQWSDWIDIA